MNPVISAENNNHNNYRVILANGHSGILPLFTEPAEILWVKLSNYLSLRPGGTYEYHCSYYRYTAYGVRYFKLKKSSIKVLFIHQLMQQ